MIAVGPMEMAESVEVRIFTPLLDVLGPS